MKRIASTFALSACLLAGAVAAQAENRALLIGIGPAYGSNGALAGPEVDVELAGKLARQMGYTDSEIKFLRENEATKANILSGLGWVADGVKDGGKAFIYYSGHGYQVADQNGDEDDGCDEAMVPVDVSKSGFVLDDDIEKYLSHMSKADVVMMVDSCFSGTITKSLPVSWSPSSQSKFFKSPGKSAPQCGKAINKALGMPRGKGVTPVADKGDSAKLLVLSATAPNEVAFADVTRTGKGSLLTQAVYDIIQERPDISFAELKDEAAARVRKASESVNLTPHHPQLDGNPDLFASNLKLEGSSGSYQGGAENATGNRELFERILNNAKFTVGIKADKKELNMGERISFSVSSAEAGYVNIVDIDASGEITVLFPNKFKDSNQLAANKELRIPADIGGFRLEATTKGESMVVALVTKTPLNLYKESAGKVLGQFKSFGNNDFGSLKRAVVARTQPKGLGVKEEAGDEKQQYGAISTAINVR